MPLSARLTPRCSSDDSPPPAAARRPWSHAPRLQLAIRTSAMPTAGDLGPCSTWVGPRNRVRVGSSTSHARTAGA